MSEFKEGQIVFLRPRQKGWESEGCTYTNWMDRHSNLGTLFEVARGADEDGDLRVTLLGKRAPTFFVRPHWIALSTDFLGNI